MVHGQNIFISQQNKIGMSFCWIERNSQQTISPVCNEKHMKVYSMSFTITEMQIISVRHHFISFNMAIIRNKNNKKC